MPGGEYRPTMADIDFSRSFSPDSQDNPEDRAFDGNVTMDLSDTSKLSTLHPRHQNRLLRSSDAGRLRTRQDSFSSSPMESRQLRTRAPRSPFLRLSEQNTQSDDFDELAGDNDGDFIPTIQSDIQPQRRARRRRRANNAAASSRFTREDSIELEYRRSSRATKNTRNMADNDAGDDFAIEDDQPAAQPKIASVKEEFQPLEEPSPFRDMHAQVCSRCNGPANTPNKGIMIHCQGCSLSFHKACIGVRSAREHIVTKISSDNFVLQCRFCVGQAKTKDPHCPNLDKCSVCAETGPSCAPFSQKKTAKQEEKLRQENDGVDPVTPVDAALINNADNVLFRCELCHRAFHYEHLPPPANGWPDPTNSKTLHGERLAEYSIDWKCRDCIDMPGKLDAIIAWRPAAKNAYKAGQTFADFTEDACEYLVKWADKSYAHCEWCPASWIWGVHMRLRNNFVRKVEEQASPPIFETKDAFPEEFVTADIVFMVRYKSKGASRSKADDLERVDDIDQALIKFQGLGYEQAVWDEPPARDSGRLWTAFMSAYDEYLNGKHFKNDTQQSMRLRVKSYQSREKKFEVVTEQPAVLRRGKLMPYQMEGLNWLLLNFYKGKSVVLADEMGLGKTVQVIALLATLILESPRCWPFLVVVPNSTCANWRREIKNWAPDLRVVNYHGGKASQALAYKHELFPDGLQSMRAHVVIMSYDSAQDDHTRAQFRNVHWAGLVVDEGQRLKNDQNLLYLALRAMRIKFRLLLTGTPLQNNKRELFNLLQFIDSENKAEELDRKYSQITGENLPELHKLIRPYFLRRTKAEVLKFLPPMAQIIVPVTMTVVQEKLCKSIMAKNPELIRSIFSKAQVKPTERGSLNNILMQLRKCLCHPFVYSEAIEDKTVDTETMNRNLIEASGKLLLLKIMLPKLKERGHRLLIFSQFLHQLDIIEDLLHIMGLAYRRLDGSMSSLEKQKRIDEFNAPDSGIFAFLLSTRAGGVGINLATADTVIVLDPDFNPHQDIQAFSRAHRIGQRKKVLCFQFMTKDSVEEKIMQIGRSKMALDHALIETMDAEDDAGNDLESILKHGAEALFSGDSEKNRIVYDSASVDKLLDRSQLENTRTDDDKTAESQFSFARVWANETASLNDDIQITTTRGDVGGGDAVGVWENIIKEREAEAARLATANNEVLGRGGRRRNKVKYTTTNDNDGLDDDNVVADAQDDRDGAFSANGDDDDDDDDDDGDASSNYGRRGRSASVTANGSSAGSPATRTSVRGRSNQGTTPKKKAASPKKTSPRTAKTSAVKTPRASPVKKTTRPEAAAAASSSPRKTAATPKTPASKKTAAKKRADLKEATPKPTPKPKPKTPAAKLPARREETHGAGSKDRPKLVPKTPSPRKGDKGKESRAMETPLETPLETPQKRFVREDTLMTGSPKAKASGPAPGERLAKRPRAEMAADVSGDIGAAAGSSSSGSPSARAADQHYSSNGNDTNAMDSQMHTYHNQATPALQWERMPGHTGLPVYRIHGSTNSPDIRMASHSNLAARSAIHQTAAFRHSTPSMSHQAVLLQQADSCQRTDSSWVQVPFRSTTAPWAEASRSSHSPTLALHGTCSPRAKAGTFADDRKSADTTHRPSDWATANGRPEDSRLPKQTGSHSRHSSADSSSRRAPVRDMEATGATEMLSLPGPMASVRGL